MQSPGPQKFKPRTAQGENWPVHLQRVSGFLLAAAFLTTLFTIATRREANWQEALLLLLATTSTLAASARQLPGQNVLFAASLIALIGGLAHSLGVKSGIPFGPFMFGANAGLKIFGTLPWSVPLLWVVVVLNSRGVARLVLRPWRKMRTYGFWLMGFTALFTMLFSNALEPFAHLKHYWIWTTTGYSLTPQGAPISNSVGWLVVTLLMLAFVTPLLINKQLSKRSTPDFQPLTVWLGGVLLFTIASAMNGLWPAVAVNGIITVLITTFAIRGARW